MGSMRASELDDRLDEMFDSVATSSVDSSVLYEGCESVIEEADIANCIFEL